MMFQIRLLLTGMTCLSLVKSEHVSIKVGVIMMESAPEPFDLRRVGPAIGIALDHIHDRYNISFETVVRTYGGVCPYEPAVGILSELYHTENIKAVLGPACSQGLMASARLAQYFGLPMVTGLGDLVIRQTGVDMFQSLTILSYDLQKLSYSVAAIMKEYQWYHTAILYDQTYVFFELAASNLVDDLKARSDVARPYDIPFKPENVKDYGDLLLEAKGHARVFIIFCNSDMLRDILHRACQLGMADGDFVFITMELFPSDWLGHYMLFLRDDSKDTAVTKAYESLLILTLRQPDNPEYESFAQEVKKRALDDYGYDFGDEKVNYFITAFYDGTIYLAEAYRTVLDEGGDINDGMLVAQRLWNNTFEDMSASGYYQAISQILSRVLDDIGVNEECVIRRRRASLLVENCYSLGIYNCDSLDVTRYMFGSQTEGCTTPGLESDMDILANLDDVNIIQEWKDWHPGIINYMMIQDETTSPGYCRLQPIRHDVPLLVEGLPDTDHVYDEKGRIIRTNNLPCPSGHVRNGPATTRPATDGVCEMDSVLAFRCQTWPSHYKQWSTRRDACAWPTPDMIRYMKSSGCFVVPVAHRMAARRDMEWRISTSLAERCLMFNLNITQIRCYIILKMVVKTFIQPYIPDTISSYICKTLLFHVLERTQRAFWTESNLLLGVVHVLFYMYAAVYSMNCPNYFCGSANLLLRKIDRTKRERLLFIIRGLVQSQGRFLLQISLDSVNTKLEAYISDRLLQIRLDSVNTRLATYISDRQLMSRYEDNEKTKLCIYMDTSANMAGTLAGLMILFKVKISHRQDEDVLSRTLEFAKRGPFKHKAASLLFPFLCSHIATVDTSERIRRQQNVSATSLQLYKLSLNSDAASSRLRFASFLYCTGQFEGTLSILQQVEQRMDGTDAMAVCGCLHQSQNISLNEDFAIKERANAYPSPANYGLCVAFSRTESRCCPQEMLFELFRSTDEDKSHRHFSFDKWMDLAVMDCVPFLHYLQYMAARQLGQRDLKYRALNKLIKCAFGDEYLGHRETVFNVLGQCMEHENRLDKALLCYRMSLQQRPRNNAVRWHFLRLAYIVFKLRRSYVRH